MTPARDPKQRGLVEAPGKFLGAVFRPGAHPESNFDYGDMAPWFSALGLWLSEVIYWDWGQLEAISESAWNQLGAILGSGIGIQYWDHILISNIGIIYWNQILGSHIGVTYWDQIL